MGTDQKISQNLQKSLKVLIYDLSDIRNIKVIAKLVLYSSWLNPVIFLDNDYFFCANFYGTGIALTDISNTTKTRKKEYPEIQHEY